MSWVFLKVVCLGPSSPLKQKTINWVTCTQQKLPARVALELEVCAEAAVAGGTLLLVSSHGGKRVKQQPLPQGPHPHVRPPKALFSNMIILEGRISMY